MTKIKGGRIALDRLVKLYLVARTIEDLHKMVVCIKAWIDQGKWSYSTKNGHLKATTQGKLEKIKHNSYNSSPPGHIRTGKDEDALKLADQKS